MNFIDIAKRRYACRTYKADKVEKEKLDLILEAAHVAPTGANRQPQKLIVVQEKESLAKVAKAADIYNAPLAIIVCGDRTRAWKRPYDGKNLTDIDTSIVTDHMMLQATELGLGTVWVCYFEPDVLRKEFSIPENLEPEHILVIGYADEEPADPDRHSETRKALNETVFYETL